MMNSSQHQTCEDGAIFRDSIRPEKANIRLVVGFITQDLLERLFNTRETEKGDLLKACAEGTAACTL